MGLIAFVKRMIFNLENQDQIYREETLQSRFSALNQGKAFKFLDLYDPFEFPLIISETDVAKFIDQKRELGEVVFEKYIVCPKCNNEIHIISEELKCHRCENEFKADKDNTYLIFKKV